MGPVASMEREFVDRWYDAFNRGAASSLVQEVGDTLHPEFECDMSRRVFNPVRYRGSEGITRFLADMAEIWARAQVEIEDIRQQGECLLVLNRFGARGVSSGAEVQRSSAHLWVFDGGLLRRFVLYPDRAEANAAFAEHAA